MNVITKSGTNELSGAGVLFLRDDRMAARLPRSPLDAARGVPADDARFEVDEFRRYNWGASLGGPIRRDRTHFFFSYDQTAQNQPFLRDIRGRGQYDAVRSAFPELVAGYLPNDDGIAAADPDRGRTASGRFLRETENLVLFGKLNHRATERHALALRYNCTDYAQVSDFVGEESRRFVKSHSTVGSLVSVVGESGVNELRVQYAARAVIFFGGGASPTTSTTSRPAPGWSGHPTRAASSGPPAGSSTPARRRCCSPPPTPTPASTRATGTPSCRRERPASSRWAALSTTTARRPA